MNTASQIDTTVLIVGGGPVGMTMALCLAKRGIASYLVELRSAETLPDVKCNHISSRSMELFRSLGISQDLRCRLCVASANFQIVQRLWRNCLARLSNAP